MTSPANAADVKALAEFSGASSDPGSNVSGVKIVYAAVQRTTPGQGAYWEWGVGWNAGIANPPPAPPSAAWTQVATTPAQGVASVAWSTPVPAGLLVSSNTYRVVLAAMDWATNLATGAASAGAGFGAEFRFDNEIPTAAVTAPSLSASLNAASLASLAGTGADATTGNSGLQNVEILLKVAGTSPDAFWNGAVSGLFTTDWDQGGGHDFWQPVTPPLTGWTKAFPPMAPVDSRRFYVWVRGADKAANAIPTPSDGQLDANVNADGSAARSFLYDNS
ncbi:MAG: hypothetical protein FD126_2902, partial [Elusimicrobia bacterium]